jgi:hypothetical protein
VRQSAARLVTWSTGRAGRGEFRVEVKIDVTAELGGYIADSATTVEPLVLTAA